MIFEMEDKGKFKIVSISKHTMVAIFDLFIYALFLTLLFLACVYPFKDTNTTKIGSFLSTTQIYIWSPLPFVVAILYYILTPKILKNKTIACWILATRIYGQENPKVSFLQYLKRGFFFILLPTIVYWMVMYIFIKDISNGYTFTEVLGIDKNINFSSSEKAEKIFARTCVLVTSILFIITSISPMFSSRRLGINDIFSNTAMVYASPYIAPQESIISKPRRMPGIISSEELEGTRELKV